MDVPYPFLMPEDAVSRPIVKIGMLGDKIKQTNQSIGMDVPYPFLMSEDAAVSRPIEEIGMLGNEIKQMNQSIGMDVPYPFLLSEDVKAGSANSRNWDARRQRE